jgi:hypothetical protein
MPSQKEHIYNQEQITKGPGSFFAKIITTFVSTL